jgi:nicotinamide-nucleotide amidase
VRTTGIPESGLAERLQPLEAELAPLTFASLPGLDGVDLRLSAWNLAPEEATQRLEANAERIRAILGDHVYGVNEEDLAGQLLSECRRRSLRIAVAESCTGGMLGERITAIPGSSQVFAGGVIAYANQVKEELGVPARILEVHGAVSEETVNAMAQAVRERYRVDLAIAVTGIAGPDGGSAEKPVGLVWIAVASGSDSEAHRLQFPGSRNDIRARACQYALWKAWLRVRDQGSGIRVQGSGVRGQGSG